MKRKKIYDLVDKIESLYNELEEVKKELSELAYILTIEEEKQETNN